MKKWVSDYWQILISVAVLLISVGANLTMIQNIRDDASAQKAIFRDHQEKDHQQALDIAKLDLRVTALDTRITATETLQRTDHDALLKMVSQVERIAQWVDRQENRKSP